MKHASAVSTRSGRRVFLVGGILFVLSGAVALLQTPLTPLFEWTYGAFGSEALYNYTVAMQFTGGALAALAMIVFAIGARGGGSVVAREPVGMIAILVFALWPYLVMLLWTVVPYSAMGELMPVISISLSLLPLVAGLVGVVEIVRLRAVPGGWRWLPAIAYLFIVGPPALIQIAQSLNWNNDQAYVPIIEAPYAIFLFASFVIPFVLGIAAIALAIAARRHVAAPDAQPPLEPPAESPQALA